MSEKKFALYLCLTLTTLNLVFACEESSICLIEALKELKECKKSVLACLLKPLLTKLDKKEKLLCNKCDYEPPSTILLVPAEPPLPPCPPLPIALPPAIPPFILSAPPSPCLPPPPCISSPFGLPPPPQIFLPSNAPALPPSPIILSSPPPSPVLIPSPSLPCLSGAPSAPMYLPPPNLPAIPPIIISYVPPTPPAPPCSQSMNAFMVSPPVPVTLEPKPLLPPPCGCF